MVSHPYGMLVLDDVEDILPVLRSPASEVFLCDIGDHISDATPATPHAGYGIRGFHLSSILRGIFSNQAKISMMYAHIIVLSHLHMPEKQLCFTRGKASAIGNE